MKDFIDKTSEQPGTQINREVMMAVQGFENISTVFGKNTVTQTNSNNETLVTTFNDDGTITETFSGTKNITKKTKFNADGSIMEELLS